MIVSVIIPTYKRSKRLPIAINSVLNQTYKNIEIIVVDDNGNNQFREETYKTLSTYLEKNQIKYICHEENQGGCKARNTGTYTANGEYIAFLDDDDFYEPEKLEKQILFLDQNKHLDACACDMFRIDDNNNQIYSRENTARGTNLKDALLDGNLFTSMLLIKKEVFVKLKGFSEIPRFQDKYFHYKFLEQGFKMGILQESLLTLVDHNDTRISLTASNKILNALNTLHNFEEKHKNIFTGKEWRFIKHRYFYNKAYTLAQGSLENRLSALGNIAKSIPYYNGKYNIIKLVLKCFIPKRLAQFKIQNI